MVLTNKDSDTRDPITVSLQRIRVDPPVPEVKHREQDTREHCYRWGLLLRLLVPTVMPTRSEGAPSSKRDVTH